MAAYYNEIDPYCSQWLRNLIAAGHIAPGDVDERDIRDVRPDDLKGYVQCHFFAGIGGWSLALRLAGWPDDRHVWTGSCPCQPFSSASVGIGGAQGQSDERHLWPELDRLIGERAPDVVFGEQVDDAIGWGWWDHSAMDLEARSYACAAQVLQARAFGARHERYRLYWVAYTSSARRKRHKPVHGIPFRSAPPFAVYGDTLARGGRALDGDYHDLLPCDGVPVSVERLRAKGYGNAIVPQVAAEFIRAAQELNQ